MYIWEYQVCSGCEKEFEKHYGPEGNWVQLFSLADGYVRTELHRDLQDTSRYVTVDYWEDKKSHDAFRKKFANEFEKLDERCESYTRVERHIGDFELTEG